MIKHLHKKSTKTIEELYKTLDVLEELASGLEKVHYNTTVSSLTGGVIGLAGGITSVVGAILAPFTFGASLIVTGVGIGVSVAGGVTAGVSNVTKMVNQRSNRQNIKMIITELQEKITSTNCCIQNIQIAVDKQETEFPESNQSQSKVHSGEEDDESTMASAGARLGRGLGGIPELVRLTQAATVGKVAAQTARAVRVAEVATGVISGLFVAVDIFFIALDSKEIHKLRKDYASIEIQESENAANNTEFKSSQTQLEEPELTNDKSEQSDTKKLTTPTKKEQELQSEIMKFVRKIRETKGELRTILDELKDELEKVKPEIPNLDDGEPFLRSCSSSVFN